MVKLPVNYPVMPGASATTIGEDGLARCPWGAAPPEYEAYHDREWGRPVGDDRAIFEKICLEGFQSGLSWLTILRKRPAFRRAFVGFEPAAVARFGSADVARLLNDAGIVRHRGKIEAAIANAQALTRLWEEGLSLAGILWANEPAVPVPVPFSMGDIAPWTPESKALSSQLRAHGFRFVGPSTAYAAMQSLGVVNDHLTGCYCRADCETERDRFKRDRLRRPGPGPGAGRATGQGTAAGSKAGGEKPVIKSQGKPAAGTRGSRPRR